ncbi:OLC1v1028426C4 [Oldenlandia corymbosa var. corymbosa]|uniref:Alkyl transferase n=1 Tax=Oldenlandia corymbosa var. corymbosa TaxID=529605 RepID=A0AAV1CBQ8_OLDCO|nr:OLC1v1028426C4 [Oldenlandia corymbosa var. corymbosa]
MEKVFKNKISELFQCVSSLSRKCVFSVLSIGPLPDHIAFIMDGNRRYAKRCNLLEGAGHKLGYAALMNMLKYCYELNIKFVTIYAFSIDNFRRRPEEVQSTMILIQEKIEDLIKEESLVNQYGVRIYFLGNLKLVSKSVRLAAERAMAATAGNSKAVLSICLAYTSTDEIVHAVQDCCDEKKEEIRSLESSGTENGLSAVRGNGKDKRKDIIVVHDVEKHMHAAVAPDPDIIIRTSGETRLSNFLLWQSAWCLLYAPSILWPQIGFRHLVWAVVEFQRNFCYLKQKMKLS